MNTDPFPLLNKTDEEIIADCVKYVDERIAKRARIVAEGKDPGLIDFIGCMGYGLADEARDVQIESGFKYFKHCQDTDRKAKAEWDKLMAKWGDRLILAGPPYGKCPVQCDGTFDGKTLYFRARHESWRLEIDNVSVAHGYYGDGEYAAGWMDEDEALQLIGLGLDGYALSLQP